jgi:hypothetical protein
VDAWPEVGVVCGQVGAELGEALRLGLAHVSYIAQGDVVCSFTHFC